LNENYPSQFTEVEVHVSDSIDNKLYSLIQHDLLLVYGQYKNKYYWVVYRD